VFDRLCSERLPQIHLLHILDEPLLERIRCQGGPTPDDITRLQSHVQAAATIGAGVVLITCSTLSPLADQLDLELDVPVVKIDQRMIERAVELGPKIGVVATSETTLEPTRKMLETEASRQGRQVGVKTLVVEGALAALLAGDARCHDKLIVEAMQSLTRWANVIVLAQASMARVLLDTKDGHFSVPVLSSPKLALAHVAALLGEDSY
jgi:Asp/Glu/hydantoin racemase